MMTIFTRYRGPTNMRGSRVTATTPNGLRATVPWDHALDADDNHDAAARKLAHAIEGMVRVWIRGYGRDGERVYIGLPGPTLDAADVAFTA